MPSTRKYSFDACVLIDIALVLYPQDVFPSFWKNLETLIQQGDLKIIEFVWDEVKGNSGIHYKSLEKQVRVSMNDLDPDEQIEIQKIVTDILSAMPTILKTKGNQVTSGGDPWIIAHAKMHGLVVVTNEKNRPSGRSIPDICNNFGVPCITLLEFFREVGWKI